MIIGVIGLSLAVIAGCKETTFQSPTSKTSFRQIETDSNLNNTDLLSAHIEDFIFNQFQAKRTSVAPLAEFTYGLVLLNAASGTTYNELANHLSIGMPDYSPLNIGVNSTLAELIPSNSYSQRQSLFMIWPVKLDQPFQLRMAETLNFDIVKLGAASLASQRALDSWWSNDPLPKTKAPNSQLSKSTDQILYLSQVQLNLNWPGELENTELSYLGKAKVVTKNSFQLVTIDCKEFETIIYRPIPFNNAGDNRPNRDVFHNLLQSEEGIEEEVLIKISAPPSTLANLTPTLPEVIISGPNDLRYMALELDGNYGVQQSWQRVNISINGKVAEPSKESTTHPSSWIIIRHAKTKVPLYAWKS